MNQTVTKASAVISPLGDSALVITFGDSIQYDIHKQIKTYKDSIESNPFPGFVECVPAFTNLTIFYNPLEVVAAVGKKQKKEFVSPFEVVSSIVQSKLENEQTEKELNHRTVSIPVCYGGEYGPDLEYVARHHNLTTEEVISIHSEGEYLAYMIGFAPGFPFLGGLSERIATPRRPSPRTSIPAGSVGIAGMQTGVYPISTPGGWQLIGQTPIKLFLPEQNPPSLLQAGDIIKFEPISKEEYQEMQAKEGEK
ncbi:MULTISPECIES: 5-oxoprolinase subunit PxpB [Priestia]|jgi:inhibitor of KinA|uniref:Allophanate hydrolase subunit 1 n=2 Tax=Priestia TaxID=2800373 RepID=D5DSS8_PRIM1|nr:MULTISPECIES: 5-oxoprolinase subunit PxpB [Priestia]AVX08514.1 kinase inhibitor [Bacillus sp. Y-01]KQU24133.1 kinase inhibitor [Bacillus sp. Leaf75]MBZ5479912.1 5-oxoprolinase subunit PxpB [Bacillus sp. T_4]MCF6796356.1 5-oxoprolinase subunit PxpB [Bacillus sp. ET1]MDH6654517.1 inhibitor of KinA [Bacillus sp. PvP124]MDP9575342.1 inhibitor of KinA [Bacillus sp. 1751]